MIDAFELCTVQLVIWMSNKKEKGQFWYHLCSGKEDQWNRIRRRNILCHLITWLEITTKLVLRPDTVLILSVNLYKFLQFLQFAPKWEYSEWLQAYGILLKQLQLSKSITSQYKWSKNVCKCVIVHMLWGQRSQLCSIVWKGTKASLSLSIP